MILLEAYAAFSTSQEDLDTWLEYYNNERPHRGYRNMGRRPIETIQKAKLLKEQEPKTAT